MSRNRDGTDADRSRWNGDGYRTSRDVFSSAYLEDRLPETDAWVKTDENELQAAFDEISGYWERTQRTTVDESRSRLEETFVRPVFRALGIPFVRHDRTDRTRRRPDYVFLESDDARDAFDCTEADGDGDSDDNEDKDDNAVAIADVRRWGRALEARDSGGHERDAETPCARIHDVLRESPAEWAVLTNGRRWRLYTERTGYRLDSYYEIVLPAVLETGDLEAFKYFYLFFRHDAFLGEADGNPFLDEVYDRSAGFTREVGATLEENAAEALEVLARGFRRYPENDLREDYTEAGPDDGLSEADLELLYDASLAALVRLVVAFAAESRARWPIEPNDGHGDGNSDTESEGLHSIARAVAAGLDRSGSAYSDRSDDLWSRLEGLGSPIGGGNRSGERPDEVPSVALADEWPSSADSGEGDGRVDRFLERHRVGDASLASVIDLLARRRSDSGGKTFVDYSSLDGRRLGDVYEGLLEHRLAIADEPLALADGEYAPAVDGDTVAVAAAEVYLTADGEQRKTTGSYYTPERVVEHTVEETIEPLLEEVRTDLTDTDTDCENGVAERAFELSILDPAMGTGHFLTSALEYLTREIVAAEDAAARAGLESVPTNRDVDEVRRQVAQRCLYGVDRDSLAVEIATASLRLRTLAADRPPAALEHHLQTGNALVGSDLEALAECASNGDGDRGDSVESGDGDSDAALLDDGTARGGTLDDGDSQTRRNGNWRSERRRRLEAMANVHTAREFGLEGVPDDALERLVAALETDDWAALARTEWFAAAQRRASAEGFFHWELGFPEIYYDEDGGRLDAPGFDAVLGNPPWVATAGRGTISATIDAALRSYLEDAFSATENQFDLYVAFYEQAIRQSRDGRVGIVVPDSILAREGNEPIREYVLANTSLSEIVRVGTAFDGVETGAVVLVSGGDGADVRCVDATGDADLASPSADSTRVNSIPASVFEAADASRFLIYLNREARSICSVVAAHPPLGDTVSVSRGEEISKRADVLRERSGPTTRPIVPGSAVCRYGIDADERRFVEPTDLEKAATNYESPKLIVRQTSDSLVGTYDADELATIKSAYNVRSDAESPAELKHLLGALHSSALAYYHHYTHAAYRAVFPQINQSTLEGLPVPMADGPDRELVAAVEKRLALTAERSAIDLRVPAYFGRDPNGPSIGDLAAVRRADGVAATKLASTTEAWPNLRIGSVDVDADDGVVRVSATVRYKPDPAAALETDRWGYAETDPIPALELVDPDDDRRALVDAFVPAATAEGDGFAGFRRTAAKTISPLDRLEALTLPRLNEGEGELRRFLENRNRARELEQRIAATDRRIDDRACSLYGLTEAERETVRREFGAEW